MENKNNAVEMNEEAIEIVTGGESLGAEYWGKYVCEFCKKYTLKYRVNVEGEKEYVWQMMVDHMKKCMQIHG